MLIQPTFPDPIFDLAYKNYNLKNYNIASRPPPPSDGGAGTRRARVRLRQSVRMQARDPAAPVGLDQQKIHTINAW